MDSSARAQFSATSGSSLCFVKTRAMADSPPAGHHERPPARNERFRVPLPSERASRSATHACSDRAMTAYEVRGVLVNGVLGG